MTVSPRQPWACTEHPVAPTLVTTDLPTSPPREQPHGHPMTSQARDLQPMGFVGVGNLGLTTVPVALAGPGYLLHGPAKAARGSSPHLHLCPPTAHLPPDGPLLAGLPTPPAPLTRNQWPPPSHSGMVSAYLTPLPTPPHLTCYQPWAWQDSCLNGKGAARSH